MILGGWPDSVFSVSSVDFQLDFSTLSDVNVIYCIFDLFIIATILLSGLSNGLADLAGISRQDGSAPRRRWLYFVCGVGTMFSAGLGAGPVILTAESAPGGMKTHCIITSDRLYICSNSHRHIDTISYTFTFSYPIRGSQKYSLVFNYSSLPHSQELLTAQEPASRHVCVVYVFLWHFIVSQFGLQYPLVLMRLLSS